MIKEFSHLYLGILNYYDIIITKLFRSASVDIEDCFSLVKAKQKEIDINRLIERFKKTASFDVSENAALKNLDNFIKVLRRKGVYYEKR